MEQNTKSHAHPPYMAIWAMLAILTAIEIWIAKLPWGRTTIIVVLVALALWKALMVALYFMHLRFEKSPLRILAAAPLPLTIIVVIAVITEFRW